MQMTSKGASSLLIDSLSDSDVPDLDLPMPSSSKKKRMRLRSAIVSQSASVLIQPRNNAIGRVGRYRYLALVAASHNILTDKTLALITIPPPCRSVSIS